MATPMQATPMHSMTTHELPTRLLWSRAGRLLLCILAVVLLMLLLPVAVHAGDQEPVSVLAAGVVMCRA